MKSILKNESLQNQFIKLLSITLLLTYFSYFFYNFLKVGAPKNDYLEFYVDSQLINQGSYSDIYDHSIFLSKLSESAGFDFKTPWFYPPTYLFYIKYLSYFDYDLSYIIFNLGLFLLYAILVLSYDSSPRSWLAISFPGLLVNFAFGQNGILSCLILLIGLRLLSSKPIISGFVLSLLIFKPNYYFLIPACLLTGKYFKSLITLLSANIALLICSLIIHGKDVWIKYFNDINKPLEALLSKSANLALMPTPLALSIHFGLDKNISLIIQGIITIVFTTLLLKNWHSSKKMINKYYFLLITQFLVNPYGSIYELSRISLLFLDQKNFGLTNKK